MSPWTEFTRENVNNVPESVMGVFQLSRGESNIAYVGRADEDLRDEILKYLDKGYTHFQWVPLPWVRETYEMQCRLYHHAGGRKRLDNVDHPYPPEGKFWQCAVSAMPPAMCEV